MKENDSEATKLLFPNEDCDKPMEVLEDDYSNSSQEPPELPIQEMRPDPPLLPEPPASVVHGDAMGSVCQPVELQYDEEEEEEIQPSRYLMGTGIGLAAAIVVGALFAGLTALIGNMSIFLAIVFSMGLGFAVQIISRRCGFFIGLASAVCGALAAVAFTVVIEYLGYCWDENTRFSDIMWIYTPIAALLAGWSGWKDLTEA